VIKFGGGEGRTDVWKLDIVFQKLEPSDSIQGAQERLANLALYPGRADGDLDDRTRRAVHRFQELERLPLMADGTSTIGISWGSSCSSYGRTWAT
jgi:peptidoglycan hydrolase-like protein with peptidoglycan-binding domain